MCLPTHLSLPNHLCLFPAGASATSPPRLLVGVWHKHLPPLHQLHTAHILFELFLFSSDHTYRQRVLWTLHLLQLQNMSVRCAINTWHHNNVILYTNQWINHKGCPHLLKVPRRFIGLAPIVPLIAAAGRGLARRHTESTVHPYKSGFCLQHPNQRKNLLESDGEAHQTGNENKKCIENHP